MRNFRYIEGLKTSEIWDIEALRINCRGFYVLMPVTKYEFGLLVSSSNRDWTKECEKLPVDDTPANSIVKTGTVRICTVCGDIVHRDPYNPNYYKCSCDDIGQVEPFLRKDIKQWRPANVEIRMKKEEK